MKREAGPILFITPGASSTGGNAFLLHFLRWFKANTSIPFLTAYSYGGVLENAFAELSPAYNFGATDAGNGLTSKIRRKLDLTTKRIVREIERARPSLIYANAVTNDEILRRLEHLDAPVVSHCHELETLIRKHGIDRVRYTFSRTDRFVAASNAVRSNLIENHSIPKDKIDLIHEFIPARAIADVDMSQERQKARQELGVPADAIVVAASGTMYWRKAPDIFIQIAAKAAQLRPDLPIYFCWVGGARAGDPAWIEASYDIQKLGLQDRVKLIEQTDDPLRYLAASDAFAMVSREDPFPLVCLESAALGKPVVCFADAGGMPEFVRDDAGFVVPYLDVQTFAERLIELSLDTALASKLGATAKERVLREHDIDVGAPAMVRVIENVRGGIS